MTCHSPVGFGSNYFDSISQLLPKVTCTAENQCLNNGNKPWISKTECPIHPQSDLKVHPCTAIINKGCDLWMCCKQNCVKCLIVRIELLSLPSAWDLSLNEGNTIVVEWNENLRDRNLFFNKMKLDQIFYMETCLTWIDITLSPAPCIWITLVLAFGDKIIYEVASI